MSGEIAARHKDTSGSENWVNLSAPGPQEAAMRDRFQRLGMSQADAIQYVLSALESGYQPEKASLALRPEDQQQLDKAYSGAEIGLQHQSNLLAQQLAGTRGLNPSDTPVSGAVMQNFLPAMAQIQSEKAQQGLGLGLQLGQFNSQLGEAARQFNMGTLLQGAQSTPYAGLNLLNSFQADRFKAAGGGQSAYNQMSMGSALNQDSGTFRNVMGGLTGR